MLVSLSVKNFAIIDNIQIDFKEGMSVITGETGAGKSLIIDAIFLLFGSRAQSDLIRYQETKASITGVFSNYNDTLINILKEIDVDYNEEDNLIIKRELYLTGKSVCKINNDIVTLSDLQKVGECIGDIHSQEDSFGLINPKNYLSFLRSKEIDKYVLIYQNILKEYKELLNEYKNKLNQNDENTQKIDYLKYQYKELSESKLSINEEENLKSQVKYLSNYNNIMEYIKNFKDIYNNKYALDLIYESLTYLNKLREYDKKFEDLYQSLNDSYYNIESVIENNAFHIDDDNNNEKEIDEINLRLSVYSELKRKYKKNTSELISYTKKIKDDLYEIDNYDDVIKEYTIKLKDLYNSLLLNGKKIRLMRIELSKQLESKIKNNLFDLELKNTLFEIKFNEIDENNTNFYKDGIDTIDFMVSFNKGEMLKPLSKVASGGELSRFMLAMKTVLGDELPMQTKIFDEIDSGVSGNVAFSIAKKIKQISKKSQVLCITHLPQVASAGNNHIKISKKISDGRTYTVIDELNDEEKINEIASMISNGNITNASITLAKELIEETK